MAVYIVFMSKSNWINIKILAWDMSTSQAEVGNTHSSY